MKFKEVARYCARIETTDARNEITALLADMLKEASPREAGILCNIVLGELYPPYHESHFNIAEKSMIPIVAAVMEKPVEAIKKGVHATGDIGLVIQEGAWHDKGEELSVSEVYQQLVTLEAIEGNGSQEKKAAHLQELLYAVDPLSAKYIVRMVLGKLRLGFSEMTIIDALSWMETSSKSLKSTLEHAYNICVDLGLIATTLKRDGIDAITHMHMQVGIPIRPAAAERLPTAQDIFDKIGPCIAQPKLDGFRLQIHIDKRETEPKIFFFSRNLKDMSAMFPDLKEWLLALPVQTLICEGEAIGYDANTHTFLPFQETVKRKRKHGVEKASQEFPLKLFLFDVLYYDGNSLLAMPCEDRYALLKELVPAQKNSPLSFIEERHITTAAQLENYFKEVIEEGLEGLVVKRPTAPYQPGKRNFNWIKLKRSAEGGLEDTIDAVILGYYRGAGRRADFGIGAMLVGVYNKQEDRFETVARVGTGFSDAQWHELKKKCDALKVSEQPHSVVCAKELVPDAWVLPQLVCEIFADEITRSPLHAAGKTAKVDGFGLRFPRFLGYRDDKSPEDATTVQEIEEMYGHQGKK
jgi:DNA ligase-1